MEWREYLTVDERNTLIRLDAEKAVASEIRRKIRDRCRKRLEKANG